jgi:hypothetical protein
MAIQEVQRGIKRFPRAVRTVVYGTSLFLALNCVAACVSPEKQYAQASMQQIESDYPEITIADPEDFSGKEYKSGFGKKITIIRDNNTENFTSDTDLVRLFNMVEIMASQKPTALFGIRASNGEINYFDIVLNPSPSENHKFIIEDTPAEIKSDLGEEDLASAVTIVPRLSDSDYDPITFLAPLGGRSVSFAPSMSGDLFNSIVEVINNATRVSLGSVTTEYLSSSVPDDQRDGIGDVFYKVGAEIYSNSLALMIGLNSQNVSYEEYAQTAGSVALQGDVSLGLNMPYIIFSEEFYDTTSSLRELAK